MPDTSKRSSPPRRPKHLVRTGFLCLIAGSLVRCMDPGGPIRPRIEDGSELPILSQITGTHCNESRPMQLVIRDPATFAQVPLRELSVDFQNEMVLVVTLGRVPSDKYAVEIDRVWREGHQLRVAVSVLAPEAGHPITPATPFCIAVVPRSDLNVARFAPEPPQRQRLWSQSQPGLGLESIYKSEVEGRTFRRQPR